MRLKIEAESQNEFEQKKADLIKAIAGSTLEVSIKPKARSRYDSEKPSTTPRQSVYQAQREMLEYWDAKFQEALREIKAEIREILATQGGETLG